MTSAVLLHRPSCHAFGSRTHLFPSCVSKADRAVVRLPAYSTTLHPRPRTRRTVEVVQLAVGDLMLRRQHVRSRLPYRNCTTRAQLRLPTKLSGKSHPTFQHTCRRHTQPATPRNSANSTPPKQRSLSCPNFTHSTAATKHQCAHRYTLLAGLPYLTKYGSAPAGL